MLKIYRHTFIVIIFVALTSVALQSHIDLVALTANYNGEAAESLEFITELAVWGWGLALFIWSLTLIMRRIEKYRDNFDNSVKVLYVILLMPAIISFVAQMAFWAIVSGLFDPVVGEKVIFGAVSVLVIMIGNYGVSVRKAWFTGLPLPWIMASDRIWQKTHRCLGRLFMLMGAIALFSLFIWPTTLVIIGMTVGFIACLAISILYSLWLARCDPLRIDNSAL